MGWRIKKVSWQNKQGNFPTCFIHHLDQKYNFKIQKKLLSELFYQSTVETMETPQKSQLKTMKNVL